MHAGMHANPDANEEIERGLPSYLSSKHLSFPHSTLCDARAMPLRLSQPSYSRWPRVAPSWARPNAW